MENQLEKNTAIRIGITHGDVNGISYEIIMKTLADVRVLEFFTPLVYGSSKVASYHRKTIDLTDFNFNIVKSAGLAQEGKANLINIYQQEIRIDLGQATRIAGEVALLALETATEDLKKGQIDALVTAPINKKSIQSKNFQFPGHTEYLSEKFGAGESLMLMVSHHMRIGVITGHVPLSKVPEILNVELIVQKILLMQQSLIRDFGILKPRIAILGLNPHAGDQGVIGLEEQQVIIPAIQKAFNDGILAFGPYSADGFFGSGSFRHFDGILAMYHDQGLIPFKALSFKSGVNFTAGLPYVRTSPAHGTAYDIAGKNEASPDAFREAVYLAVEVVRNRRNYDKITANPLSATFLDADTDCDRNALKDLPDNGD